MQITGIVKGTVDKNFGKTVSESLNEILRNNPRVKLESWQVMETKGTYCSLLCIFSVPDKGRGLDDQQQDERQRPDDSRQQDDRQQDGSSTLSETKES